MRRTIATAITAVLLAATQTTAAHAAPAAPSDVQIGWSGTKLHLTWQDAGEANSIRVEYSDLTQVLATTAAGEANDVLLPAALVDQDKVRITVTARTADGESAATPTAWFDTRRPGYPFIQDAGLLSDLSVRIAWTQAAPGADTTPNDPMDRPASDEWLRATVETPGHTETVALVPGTTQATLAPRPRPATILLSAGNEWGTAYEKATDPPKRWVKVGTMTAKTAVPAQAAFGDYLRISSALDEYFCACAEQADSGIPVWLQARPTAAAPWQTVGRYSGETVNSFSTGITSVGGRQFRLWVPARKTIRQTAITLTPASSTTARPSKTLAHFVVAGFNVTSAQVGQLVKLTVDVRPGGTVKGALQRWDGKYWRSVLAVPVTKGKAVMYVRAAGRGTTTTYRVAVPGMTYYGLPIESTGSRSFTLTVR